MALPKGSPRPIGAGRKPGTQNAITKEAKAIARAILEQPAVRRRYNQQAIDGTLPTAIETLLWHYAYGVPKQVVEHTGAQGQPLELFEVVINWQPLPHHDQDAPA